MKSNRMENYLITRANHAHVRASVSEGKHNDSHTEERDRAYYAGMEEAYSNALEELRRCKEE